MRNSLQLAALLFIVALLPYSATAQTTIFADDFSDDTVENPSITVSVSSDQDWGTGTAGGASNAPVAQANGFGGDVPSEDWLITSGMDFSAFTNESLTFISAVGFDDTGLDRGLDVLISSDYSGSGDPNAATWTDISSRVQFAQDSDKPGDGNFSDFVPSGAVDLSDVSFQGTEVYVAFRYTSSGTGQGDTEQWQVDDIVIEGASTLPVLSFANDAATVGEGDGSTTITVEIQNVNGSPVSAEVVLSASSTATASDIGNYTPQTVSFPGSANNGDTQTITVNITDDLEAEGDEIAAFNLKNLSNAFASPGTFDLTITDNDSPLVINEILADPGSGLDGDANGDGTRDFADDEFVEIYNTSAESVDLSGYVIEDGSGDRHTFPDGSTLDGETAVVVFGGGTPAATIPGLVQTASTGELGLNNSGDTVTLLNTTGSLAATVTYGSEGGNDQSLTRSPDFTGSFVEHSTASGSGGALFSPGATVDGSPLPVELASFDGQFTGESISLSWQTLTETGNAGFELQHRPPGASSFVNAGFVEGNGTTDQVSNYTFVLNTAGAGTHTFRLLQVDVDGDETLSDPITVKVVGDPVTLTGPNPATPGAKVEVLLRMDASQNVDVAVYNLLGQKVATIYAGPVVKDRVHRRTVDVSTLASGVYFVRVLGETMRVTEKLSVVK